MSATRKAGAAEPSLWRPGGGPPVRPAGAGRIVAYVVLFLLGWLAAVAGVLVQAGWFPGGLLLALAGTGGIFLGGSHAVGSRTGAVTAEAGWLIGVLLLTSSRPEGDFLVGASLGSYLFLLGGLAVAVMCATLWQPAQPGGDAARLGK